MKSFGILGWAVVFFLGSSSLELHAGETIPLASNWRFALDRTDAGVREQWFNRSLPDRVKLPGVLQAQGYGDEISTNTPWVLTLYDRFWYLREDYKAYTRTGNVTVPFLCQPPRHYLGAAWYQRDIEIPPAWAGRRVVLTLERPHWETRVWLDDQLMGTNNSLVAPHEFELGSPKAGQHRLSIRVDNRMILPYRPDGHSVSDSLGYSWNGIAGNIELRSTPLVWIEDVQVYPNLTNKSALVKVELGNATGKTATNLVAMSFIPQMAAGGGAGRVLEVVSTSRWTTVEAEVPSSYPVKTWDEFDPQLFELTVSKRSPNLGDEARWELKRVLFGFHEFKTEGTEFVINGRKTYLRGTHFGGDFPLTGYPPTDVESWKKIIRTCQAWGLNHMRFHSWCPPEAAFTAADELGFYLQPECGMWNSFTPGGPMEAMLDAETARMIKAYGNHPSFVMVSPSNEPAGRWTDVLPQWVSRWKARDPRRLFTVNTGRVTPGSGASSQYQIRPVRGPTGWFGRDYSRQVANDTVPVVAHELGQWCAYPDYDVIRKFTGYLQPGNYEIFRDSLAAHGLLAKDKDFTWASGRLQLACYKEEIEANLRTPGMGGFQLLDLHDYIGQGTALVGVLDPFWEAKGYVNADEWRQFCSPTVPLARMSRQVFTTADKFEVPVEIAHYGSSPLTNHTASWVILNAAGSVVEQGEWPRQAISVGKGIGLGTVAVDLAKLAAPAAYQLQVAIATRSARDPEFYRNHWPFWLYPAHPDDSTPKGIQITSSWEEAETNLLAGGRVLFLPHAADLDWSSPPLASTPIFWNRLMNPGWTRMLGLWCDAKHPALAEFPTEANGDWQWIDLLRGVRAINLDRLPRGLQPIVQAIDDWNRNWKLGLIFEAEVGRGRLVACSFDLSGNLDNRPGALQLRRSLLDYMAGSRFQPKAEISMAQFRALYFDSRIMRKLGAVAKGAGTGAASAIDGDPNTFWSAGGPGRGGAPAPESGQPHELTVTFPAPVPMHGVVLMSRQNDRNHLGDVRAYTVQVSDDGRQWREVSRGELVSTWNPQQVRFAQTVTAKQLKFTALSGFGPDTSTALAELAVMYAGPRLADSSSGNVEYQPVRSTTVDVDEPAPPTDTKKK